MLSNCLRQLHTKTYLHCPCSYQYNRTDQLQPQWRNSAVVHDTVIHRIIERLHSGEWDLDVEAVYAAGLVAVETTGDEAAVPIHWKGDRKKL